MQEPRSPSADGGHLPNGRARRIGRGKPEPERRSLPELTLDRQLAAHQCGELAADGQTESSSAGAPGVAILDLDERMKDALEIVGADPDAGVLDLDPDLFPAAVARGMAISPADFDAAVLVGELHGVREQVGQDLLDAMRVAKKARRAGGFRHYELQKLRLGLRPDVLTRALDGVTRRPRH